VINNEMCKKKKGTYVMSENVSSKWRDKEEKKVMHLVFRGGLLKIPIHK